MWFTKYNYTNECHLASTPRLLSHPSKLNIEVSTRILPISKLKLTQNVNYHEQMNYPWKVKWCRRWATWDWEGCRIGSVDTTIWAVWLDDVCVNCQAKFRCSKWCRPWNWRGGVFLNHRVDVKDETQKVAFDERAGFTAASTWERLQAYHVVF